MTTGPGDRKAVGARGGGHLRASDADREQVIDTLKDAFVQGRLTMDELGMRTGQALVSRTYAELTAITADIPGRPIEVPEPLRDAEGSDQGDQREIDPASPIKGLEHVGEVTVTSWQT